MSAHAGSKLAPLTIPKPKQSSAWALSETEFAAGMVGGKSGNLAKLRGKLPADIAVPASVALPFGTFERVLKDGINKDAAAAVAKAQKALVSFISDASGNGASQFASVLLWAACKG